MYPQQEKEGRDNRTRVRKPFPVSTVLYSVRCPSLFPVLCFAFFFLLEWYIWCFRVLDYYCW